MVDGIKQMVHDISWTVESFKKYMICLLLWQMVEGKRSQQRHLSQYLTEPSERGEERDRGKERKWEREGERDRGKG